MATENLDNLARIRQLKTELATKDEIKGLLRSGKVRLADAKNESLSQASRFDLAYNAAHALSLAALRRAGYRSENRYLVFQCTLGLAADQRRVLDQAHRKRNLAEYEGDVEVGDQLLEALIRVADLIVEKLQQ